MSQTGAAIRFLSWARRGAAAVIDAPDMGVTAPARVKVPVAVRFNNDVDAAELELELLGPGDVVAFDPRAIVRAWPPPETRDAEPNYFPLVEVDQVDLPWRYTPRAANATGRLRPWLCLIVVREDEATYQPLTGGRAAGKVTLAAGMPMPRVDQSWAWVHVQVSGDDEDTSADVITDHPSRAVARFLCPRRLDGATTYWAMLVPTFEVGRRAGLGLPLGTSIDALDPAWDGDQLGSALELPVYYRWRFGTGHGGDFETLVRVLEPRPLPPTVGARPLDVSQPGTLPLAAVEPVPLGGALRAPAADPWLWPADQGERSIFVQRLAALLDYPDVVRKNGGTPLVAPPLYGMWHARSWRLQSGSPPVWFDDLNRDPRKRIGAALGTEVVQELQEELMASAWDQLAGIREANDQLRKAQLARAIGERLHLRFVQPSTADGVLAFTAPTLGHIRPATKTVRALAKSSPPRLALVGSAFRRVGRPLGPLGRRQGRAVLPQAPVVSQVNAGAYDTVLAAEPPSSPALPTWQWIIGLDGWPSALDEPLEADEVNDAAPIADIKNFPWDVEYGNPPDDDPLGGNPEPPSMTRFRAAAIALDGRNVAAADGEILRRLDMPALRAAVAAAVDPAATIPAAMLDRLTLQPGFTWNPPDPIEPVMAHPEFERPMYQPLAARSPDWILPGLGDVSANSVALAVTNPAFIEAYMVGLNHEMARELLWREFPTDQRGSYFRQFWDPAGLWSTPVPETAKDITRLDQWASSSELGSHSPRPVPPDATHLVLLVRGEVLRRYPGTLVYAQRAQGPVGERTLVPPEQAGAQRRPVFGGRLDPDVAFFGFDLALEDVRGDETNPGWFFVFEEQPGEPRFGLDVSSEDPPATWDDLAWTHLAATPEALAAIQYIDLASSLPDTSTIDDEGAGWHVTGAGPVARGADHAFITYQRPVRVAMHGSVLLPP
ncbi:MAG: hypothetical protein F9K40_04145 [Kofleriaceae bacterium]|nr:MAG: hypothetical protein F9K40_04145 [Kofleriaceae bacterium]MBZ0232263.1 hypothetical protein [Kofleriaceae bacterium]